MSNIIEQLENEQMNREVPDFNPGDTVVVQVKVKEGERERVQAFEGVVIAKRNRGLNSSFTVRKMSHGEGVERVFQTYSPAIEGVTVKRRGDVRRAVSEGAATVFGGAAPLFGLDAALDPEEQATREAGQMAAHCDALPEDVLPGMVEAQRLRDAALAAAMDRQVPMPLSIFLHSPRYTDASGESKLKNRLWVCCISG